MSTTPTTTTTTPTNTGVEQIGLLDSPCTVRFPLSELDKEKRRRTLTVYLPHDVEVGFRLIADTRRAEGVLVEPFVHDDRFNERAFIRVKVTEATRVTGQRSSIHELQRGDKVCLACKMVDVKYEGKEYLAFRCKAIYVVAVGGNGGDDSDDEAEMADFQFA